MCTVPEQKSRTLANRHPKKRFAFKRRRRRRKRQHQQQSSIQQKVKSTKKCECEHEKFEKCKSESVIGIEIGIIRRGLCCSR